GNMLVELNGKAKAYSNGCKSPFDKGVGFRVPLEQDPRDKEPKKDDPDYAAKLAVYKAFCFERDVYNEIKNVRTDFFTQVSAISQAYGPDFFAYVPKHASDPNIRRKYKINTPEGYTLFDSSLREPFNAPYVLAALDRQPKDMNTIKFASVFGGKLTWPYEDFAVEEFIDKLLGPTIEEVDEPMNAAGSSTDAPSHSPSGKTAGAAKQEPTSAPMETDAAEGGSASGDVSGVKVEQSERSSFEEVSGTKDVHMQDAGDTGKHDADEATGSSPPGEEPMPDINSSSSADASDEEKLHDQGIWGKQKNIVEPGAYEAEARATAEAEANNEQAFENIAGAKEKASLIDTDEYKDFVRTRHLIERLSPLTKLADQQHGYALAGLYHDVIRFDEIGSFKVQHMGFRIRVNHHNHMKYNLSEEDLIDLSGDYRSTLDDRAMARASRAREEELMNAMLHYFLAAGVDEEELGDLSLETMPNPMGPAEDGPVPVYASKTKYSVLVLNLGSFARSRKKT
ncbi:unnamed protein product, partial [Symbiodinium microadriaticum]